VYRKALEVVEEGKARDSLADVRGLRWRREAGNTWWR
jgi:hypothetical protein